MVGAGCAGELPSRPQVNVAPSIVNESYGAWKTVGADIERFEVPPASPTSTHLVLYRFRPEAFQWSFAYASSSQRISDWVRAKPGMNLVVNAAYFDTDFTPTGFLQINGERIGRRQFDLDRSSLVQIDRVPQIVERVTGPKELERVQNGAQSYPLLIQNGGGAIAEDSGLLARRTAIGTDTKGRIYLIIAPDQPVTLYRFMEQLVGMGIQWKSVLNFDGGPSSGVSIRSGNWSEMYDSFTSIPIVLTARHL